MARLYISVNLIASWNKRQGKRYYVSSL